jgi:hypothetical protein
MDFSAESIMTRNASKRRATTIPFHERLIARQEFAGGEMHTRWVGQQMVQ